MNYDNSLSLKENYMRIYQECLGSVGFKHNAKRMSCMAYLELSPDDELEKQRRYLRDNGIRHCVFFLTQWDRMFLKWKETGSLSCRSILVDKEHRTSYLGYGSDAVRDDSNPSVLGYVFEDGLYKRVSISIAHDRQDDSENSTDPEDTAQPQPAPLPATEVANSPVTQPQPSQQPQPEIPQAIYDLNVQFWQEMSERLQAEVIEGTITETEANKWLVESMQLETKITGGKNAVLVPNAQRTMNNLFAIHDAGKQAGWSNALYDARSSIGNNIVNVMRGNISASEAAGNVARDTAISYGTGYVNGAVNSAISRTAAGKAISSAVSSATTAFEGTAIGGAITSSTAAVSGLATTATTGAVGAIGAAGSAVGSALTAATAGTAIGGAVASGVATAAVAGTAVAAVAVAAAPVAVATAAVGAVGSFISSFFD